MLYALSTGVCVDVYARARYLGFDSAQHLNRHVVRFLQALVALDFEMKVYEFLRAGTTRAQVVKADHAAILKTMDDLGNALVYICGQATIHQNVQ